MSKTSEAIEPDPAAAAAPQSLGRLLRRAAAQFGNKIFVEDGAGRAISFTEAAHRVQVGVASLREAGLVAGDRVGICLPNDISWPLVWLSVVSGGYVAVPINRSYQAADIGHILDDAQISAVVTSSDSAHKFTDLQPRDDQVRLLMADELFEPAAPGGDTEPRDLGELDTVSEDSALANLQFTSGTSGLPKACMLTHSYWLKLGVAMGRCFELTHKDRVLTAQPFSYIDGQWEAAMCLEYGATLIVLPRFSASTFWADVRRYRATVLYVLGSMPQLLFQQPATETDRANDVRLVLCSAIPVALHHKLESRWDAPWREVYGLTESGLNITAPIDDERSVGQGYIGLPAPNCEARIVDPSGRDAAPGEPGELLVRGPTLMTGYWRRPEATAAALKDGWFHTGDLCVREENGWFRLVGRLKDMVRRGGENIAAAEVEAVICELPFVRACAVVGVADELFGEEVMACIEVGDAEALPSLAREVEQHTRQQLAIFKVPRYVEFWRSLPRTPSERIAKTKIADYDHGERLLAVDFGQQGKKAR
ncbi:class I adenylate-forming enzyme family protein [Sphaerisporangium siamense]|uniref:Acyl-CoA synthetase (AMP-forming)/AMP-acid ligase II n=1 Tax=Sphaerisporangium siamense TaxID=795645 RepID=A0A7W7DD11_9ACTN|nr:AMP-binding protein [Sphaerisporangium siamense]MBB4704579.1 acyl-CoA synthetase (AMP-forming)/AMP-acid ligase II [Sphaerisporangium siamense]